MSYTATCVGSRNNKFFIKASDYDKRQDDFMITQLEPEFDDCGNVIKIYASTIMDYNFEYFEKIADIVEAGSKICFIGEDWNPWTLIFDGNGEVVEQNGKILWE